MNFILSYFTHRNSSGEWDVFLIPQYARKYMLRCAAAFAILYALSSIAEATGFEALHILLGAGAAIFAIFLGLYLAAMLDFYRS